MGWKKALFFGGAVLLLAACSRDATAPNSLVRVEGAQAAARSTSTKTATTPLSPTTLSISTECSGVVIRTGDIDICVPIEQ